MTIGSGPAGADIPRDLAHRKRGDTVDIKESSVFRPEGANQDPHPMPARMGEST